VELTEALIRGRDLTSAQTQWVIRETVEGRADNVRLAGFLTALQAKGPTAAELLGVVNALLDSAVVVPTTVPRADIAGTGGDGTGAINLSTLAALIAAGAGVTMIKHGGRAASSRSAGSADLAESLASRWMIRRRLPRSVPSRTDSVMGCRSAERRGGDGRRRGRHRDRRNTGSRSTG